MITSKTAAWFHGSLLLVNASAFALSVHIAIFEAQWSGAASTLSVFSIAFSYAGLMVCALILFACVMRLWYGWFPRVASHMGRYGWIFLEACLAILPLTIGLATIISVLSDIECGQHAGRYDELNLAQWCAGRQAVSVFFLLASAMCIAAVIVLAAFRFSRHLEHILDTPPHHQNKPPPPLPRPTRNPPVPDDSAPVPPCEPPMVQQPAVPLVTIASSTTSSSDTQQSTDQPVTVPDMVCTTADRRTPTERQRASNLRASTDQATLPSSPSMSRSSNEPTTLAIDPEQSSTAQIRSSDIPASRQPTNPEPPIDGQQVFREQLQRIVTSLNQPRVPPDILIPPRQPDNQLCNNEQTSEQSSNTRSQASTTITSKPPEFFCSIHQEQHPGNVLVRIKGCDHEYCRDGLKNYIHSKLNDSQVPLCPMCPGRTPNKIPPDQATEIGISQTELQRWADVAMLNICVKKQCLKCNISFSVLRQEFKGKEFIVCPMQDCNYRWCKYCHKEVPNDKVHDSYNDELKQEARNTGYQICPGCLNLIGKAEGCDHIRCQIPDCHTHFCYLCGDDITPTVYTATGYYAFKDHEKLCRKSPTWERRGL